jgi:hypothetical protein
MASITAYQNNKFRAFVERHGIRKSRTFTTRDAAAQWAAELEAMPPKQLAGLCSLKERYDIAHTALVTSIPMRVLEANAAIPYKHAEILEAAVPCAKASGIYFLIKGSEVIYVGQSLDMLHRIARHRREGKDFDGYACVECEIDKLDEMEAQYIAAFAPRKNMSFGRHRAATP